MSASVLTMRQSFEVVYAIRICFHL
jgi:hypothetical protein